MEKLLRLDDAFGAGKSNAEDFQAMQEFLRLAERHPEGGTMRKLMEANWVLMDIANAQRGSPRRADWEEHAALVAAISEVMWTFASMVARAQGSDRRELFIAMAEESWGKERGPHLARAQLQRVAQRAKDGSPR